MKNTQDDIMGVWRYIAEKIKGRGKVLSDKETAVVISPGKRSGEVEIILEPIIIRAMEEMVINETRKLVIKTDRKHHLLRYLAFCGGIEFSSHKIKAPDMELFYALGFIFQQTLRRIKRVRVEKEKEKILSQTKEIVSRFLHKGKKMRVSVFYSGGFFILKANGFEDPIKGVNCEEVMLNLKKELVS